MFQAEPASAQAVVGKSGGFRLPLPNRDLQAD